MESHGREQNIIPLTGADVLGAAEVPSNLSHSVILRLCGHAPEDNTALFPFPGKTQLSHSAQSNFFLIFFFFFIEKMLLSYAPLQGAEHLT